MRCATNSVFRRCWRSWGDGHQSTRRIMTFTFHDSSISLLAVLALLWWLFVIILWMIVSYRAMKAYESIAGASHKLASSLDQASRFYCWHVEGEVPRERPIGEEEIPPDIL